MQFVSSQSAMARRSLAHWIRVAFSSSFSGMGCGFRRFFCSDGNIGRYGIYAGY